MAALRGTVQGNRGVASRLGHSHIRTEAQSWSGKICVELKIDDGAVHYAIFERPHHGKGITRCIDSGIVGEQFSTRNPKAARLLDAVFNGDQPEGKGSGKKAPPAGSDSEGG